MLLRRNPPHMSGSDRSLVTFYGPMSFFHSVASWQLEAIDTDIRLSREIIDVSQADPAAIWQLLRTSPDGLTQQEANARLELIGPNLIARECRPSIAKELCGQIKNPLNVLLLSLAVISYFLGEISTALMILVIVILAIFTAFVQEHRSNDAAAKLRAMVKTTASVKRKGGVIASELDQFHGFIEIPMEQLVPGDIVRLSAGDMIPADLRLLAARDLFVSQSALTGEAMPSEKSAAARIDESADPFDLPNVCFMGGSVVSGYGDGVIVHTGARTYFGQLADRIAGRRELTSFDKGVNHFTWLMIRFMMVMAPAVFLINGVTKHNWLEALLFAMAVAVGLTPEMLPMIVTVNLAKGAIAMSKKRVIVKRLNAIQNFGAMDVLCADKTGTLTQDRITLKRHLDIRGGDSERVLEYAYLNSHYQSGLKNLLDVAVLQHVELGKISTCGTDIRLSMRFHSTLSAAAFQLLWPEKMPARMSSNSRLRECSRGSSAVGQMKVARIFSFAKERSKRFSRPANITSSTEGEENWTWRTEPRRWPDRQTQ